MNVPPEDFTKSYWLIAAEQQLAQRDPLDAYKDALALLESTRQRLDDVLAQNGPQGPDPL